MELARGQETFLWLIEFPSRANILNYNDDSFTIHRENYFCFYFNEIGTWEKNERQEKLVQLNTECWPMDF